MAQIVMHNYMGFTANKADGTKPAPMDDAALGLRSAVYMAQFLKDGSTTADPRVDVKKVIDQFNCPGMPWGASVMMDFEQFVAKMVIVQNGVFVPNPARLQYQVEMVNAIDAARSTVKGRAAKIVFFHSAVSYPNAQNPANWFAGWRSGNETLIEPVLGAANGILGKCDATMGRCYREYKDAILDRDSIAIIAAETKRLAPGKPSIGLMQPRKSGANWGAERFDYLSKEQMGTTLAAVKGKFDEYGLWNSGHYGPQGWTTRQAGTFYAIDPVTQMVVGDEFTPSNGWWQAVKEFMRVPVVATMPAGGGGVNLGGGGVR